jgi:hypothetical protein
MFKNLLLSCLVATLTLTIPLSVQAKILGVFPLSLSVTSKPLSKSDLNTIKKEIDDLMKAMNNGNSKKFLGHYSKKYQAITSDGRTTDYNELAQGADAGLGLMKAFGAKIYPENIQVTSIGAGKAVAEISYKVDYEKLPMANSQKSKRGQKQTIILTLEKSNSRWLVVSQESLKETESTVATNNNSKITPKDKQTFSALFKSHIDALNRKDLKAYLATLDPTAPQYDKVRQETAQLLKDFTLKYTIESVKVIELNKQEAVVEMVATVKKVSGGSFTDSKMVTANLLKKTNGKWRIYDTSLNLLTALKPQK